MNDNSMNITKEGEEDSRDAGTELCDGEKVTPSVLGSLIMLTQNIVQDGQNLRRAGRPAGVKYI